MAKSITLIYVKEIGRRRGDELMGYTKDNF